MKMKMLIAQRIHNMPKSFVREILKVTTDPSVISFAGGLPNADTFPIVEIAEATACVMKSNGQSALQYSTTQGLPALRLSIARDLQQRSGRDVDPDEILITSGSQQGLDLIGKVFLDKGDTVVMERPGYLGAIQALRAYEPCILTVPLGVDGINLNELKRVLDLFDLALKEKVAFVPGTPFYTDGSGENHLRLNFSNADEQHIEIGIQRLGKALKRLMEKCHKE